MVDGVIKVGMGKKVTPVPWQADAKAAPPAAAPAADKAPPPSRKLPQTPACGPINGTDFYVEVFYPRPILRG
jgi:hypothetical protein